MRLKSIRIKIAKDRTVQAVPQYFGAKGSTITLIRQAELGLDVRTVLVRLLEKIKFRSPQGL